MLLSIIANCKCDVCGKTFQVALDPADSVPQGWTLFEMAEDKARGAFTSAVRDGVWMCSVCEIADRQAAEAKEHDP